MRVVKYSILFTILILSSCGKEQPKQIENTGTDAKSYWYNGDAEITSYELNQARYGEIRQGKAVLVFVTEPFLPAKFTKVEKSTENSTSVLKLNFTKKFATGIYPYSMMTSTFFPFENGEHSLKVSSSSQEWCGNSYMELKNKDKYEVQLNSYFEDESFDKKQLEKDLLEDDFWTMIRLNPDELPTGETKVIPSFFILRLMHIEMKAYNCQLSKSSANKNIDSYTISYPELERTLSIHYKTKFPYEIVGWEETYFSGWGEKRKQLTTTANKIKTLKLDYWNKNTTEDDGLRNKLGLE